VDKPSTSECRSVPGVESHLARLNLQIWWSNYCWRMVNCRYWLCPLCQLSGGRVSLKFDDVTNSWIRSRWEGTYSGSVGTVANGLGCAGGVGCSCTNANANSSDYSKTYKEFLSDFYIAQVKYSQARWCWYVDDELWAFLGMVLLVNLFESVLISGHGIRKTQYNVLPIMY